MVDLGMIREPVSTPRKKPATRINGPRPSPSEQPQKQATAKVTRKPPEHIPTLSHVVLLWLQTQLPNAEETLKKEIKQIITDIKNLNHDAAKKNIEMEKLYSRLVKNHSSNPDVKEVVSMVEEQMNELKTTVSH